ncbi:MAG: J domain-containing protein [Aquificaceae bacterium]|nr:J domain-containing protein [Aquificaceae bacterium]MDW8031993.1 J domain-containing protein [Aquificaceae bacterium]
MTVIVTERELRWFIEELIRGRDLTKLIKLVNLDQRRFLPLIMEMSKFERSEFYPVIRDMLRGLKVDEKVFMQSLNLLKDSLLLEEDPYSILEVSRNATTQEIKSAWRRLIKTYHPDAGGSEGEKARKINEAYRILSDPELKKHYDTLSPVYSQESIILIRERKTAGDDAKWKAFALVFFFLLLFGLFQLLFMDRKSPVYQDAHVTESSGDAQDTENSSRHKKGVDILQSGEVNKSQRGLQALSYAEKKGSLKGGWQGNSLKRELDKSFEKEKKPVISSPLGLSTPGLSRFEKREEEKSEVVPTEREIYVKEDPRTETQETRAPLHSNRVEQVHRVEEKKTFEVGFEQINAFFMLYSRTYSSGNVKALMGFFSEDARENGRLVRSIYDKYEELFRRHKVVYFRIKVLNYNLSEGVIDVAGEFSVVLSSEEANLKSSGPIRIKINTYGGGINEWRIKELNYKATSVEKM